MCSPQSRALSYYPSLPSSRFPVLRFQDYRLVDSKGKPWTSHHPCHAPFPGLFQPLSSFNTATTTNNNNNSKRKNRKPRIELIPSVYVELSLSRPLTDGSNQNSGYENDLWCQLTDYVIDGVIPLYDHMIQLSHESLVFGSARTNDRILDDVFGSIYNPLLPTLYMGEEFLLDYVTIVCMVYWCVQHSRFRRYAPTAPHPYKDSPEVLMLLFPEKDFHMEHALTDSIDHDEMLSASELASSTTLSMFVAYVMSRVIRFCAHQHILGGLAGCCPIKHFRNKLEKNHMKFLWSRCFMTIMLENFVKNYNAKFQKNQITVDHIQFSKKLLSAKRYRRIGPRHGILNNEVAGIPLIISHPLIDPRRPILDISGVLEAHHLTLQEVVTMQYDLNQQVKTNGDDDDGGEDTLKKIQSQITSWTSFGALVDFLCCAFNPYANETTRTDSKKVYNKVTRKIASLKTFHQHTLRGMKHGGGGGGTKRKASSAPPPVVMPSSPPPPPLMNKRVKLEEDGNDNDDVLPVTFSDTTNVMPARHLVSMGYHSFSSIDAASHRHRFIYPLEYNTMVLPLSQFFPVPEIASSPDMATNVFYCDERAFHRLPLSYIQNCVQLYSKPMCQDITQLLDDVTDACLRGCFRCPAVLLNCMSWRIPSEHRFAGVFSTLLHHQTLSFMSAAFVYNRMVSSSSSPTRKHKPIHMEAILALVFHNAIDSADIQPSSVNIVSSSSSSSSEESNGVTMATAVIMEDTKQHDYLHQPQLLDTLVNKYQQSFSAYVARIQYVVKHATPVDVVTFHHTIDEFASQSSFLRDNGDGDFVYEELIVKYVWKHHAASNSHMIYAYMTSLCIPSSTEEYQKKVSPFTNLLAQILASPLQQTQLLDSMIDWNDQLKISFQHPLTGTWMEQPLVKNTLLALLSFFYDYWLWPLVHHRAWIKSHEFKCGFYRYEDDSCCCPETAPKPIPKPPSSSSSSQDIGETIEATIASQKKKVLEIRSRSMLDDQKISSFPGSIANYFHIMSSEEAKQAALKHLKTLLNVFTECKILDTRACLSIFFDLLRNGECTAAQAGEEFGNLIRALPVYTQEKLQATLKTETESSAFSLRRLATQYHWFSD